MKSDKKWWWVVDEMGKVRFIEPMHSPIPAQIFNDRRDEKIYRVDCEKYWWGNWRG